MPEICDNGVDDDLDGLLDCEDDDCATDPFCDELCDNGIDDNADGLIDCEDANCWGTGCSAVWVQLSGADSAVYSTARWNPWVAYTGASCGYVDVYYPAEFLDFALVRPTGTLQFLATSASTPSTCAWTADALTLRAWMSYSWSSTPGGPGARANLGWPESVELTGFDCPGLVAPGAEGLAMVALARLSLQEQSGVGELRIDEDLWATVQGPLQPSNATYYTSSYQTFSGSCTFIWPWRAGTRTFSSVGLGDAAGVSLP